MTSGAINIGGKFDLIEDQWSPRVIAELNDYQFKIARIEGDFIWHSHPETDEAFWLSRATCASISAIARRCG
jgi:hypothetical protein